MSKTSAKHKLRSPFVVTVAAAAAAVVAGCSGSVSTTEVRVTTNPPPPDAGGDASSCPSAAPTSGTACTPTAKATCDYGPCEVFSCSPSGSWQYAVSCNPPPCPDTAPTLDAACDPNALPRVCNYPMDAKACIVPGPADFSCDMATRKWTSAAKATCPGLPPVVGSACGGLCPTTLAKACEYRPSGVPAVCNIYRVCDNGTWQDRSPRCEPDAGP